jgi:hypothetical protein
VLDVCFPLFFSPSEIQVINTQLSVAYAELKALELEEASFPPRLARFKSPVTLNVGGMLFFATTMALSSQPSLFRTLLEGYAAVTLYKDAIFIDRDPQVFSLILEFLARGKVALEDLSPHELALIALDANFYELKDLELALGSYFRVDVETKPIVPELEDGIGFQETLRRVMVHVESKRAEIKERKEGIQRHLAKIERCMCGEVVALQAQSGSAMVTLLSTLTSQDGPLRRRFSRRDLWAGDVTAAGCVFVDESQFVLKQVRRVCFLEVCFEEAKQKQRF